jgi:4-carboxymuconolactone decarboxylase
MRATIAGARRKTKQISDAYTPAMVEPVNAFAHTPGWLLGYGALELANERAHRVELRLKEMAVLKAATLMGCEYCLDIGSKLARESGLTDEQLLALSRYRESGLFSELEMLVLDYTVAMSRTPVTVTDELFAALREHLSDEQVVELTATIALENFRGRFNSALDIGAAGFSEGMVCAVPDAAGAATEASAGAAANPAANGAPHAAAL